MNIDITLETPISTSIRAAQVSSMFDVPPEERAHLEWHGTMPLDERPWQIGLIVGPSGAGKTTILHQCFGVPTTFEWQGASVIDDFGPEHTINDLAAICQAVGFNTIPAWLRPYAVLSNGEKFRVDLARRLIDHGVADHTIVCDEFTSVVDRQVARIGAHAVQKYVRRQNRQFVAATCHYDLEEWLQPDWVLEPATMTFRWRSVQRRPDIACTIHRAPWSAWQGFSRFHYLTSTLHGAAKNYILCVDGEPASIACVLYRPHPRVRDVYALTRGVTLPDYQGLGLFFALIDRLGAAYKARGKRLHLYPAHPSFIRSADRSEAWELIRKPGMTSSSRKGPPSAFAKGMGLVFGGRPCAAFVYCGPAMQDRQLAAELVEGGPVADPAKADGKQHRGARASSTQGSLDPPAMGLVDSRGMEGPGE